MSTTNGEIDKAKSKKGREREREREFERFTE
jgi:hypothetical protein